MALSYFHVYSYENKFDLTGGNALNNLKENLLSDYSLILIRIISKRFYMILTVLSNDRRDQGKTAETSALSVGTASFGQNNKRFSKRYQLVTIKFFVFFQTNTKKKSE